MRTQFSIDYMYSIYRLAYLIIYIYIYVIEVEISIHLILFDYVYSILQTGLLDYIYMLSK